MQRKGYIGGAVGLGVLVAGLTAEAQQLAFVNRSFAPGFNLMANPLQTGSNTLNEVLPLVPPGTRLSKFNNGLQAYEPAQTFVQNVGWVPGGLTLSPGEGAFLYAPTQFVATFVGHAQEHDRSWPSVPLNGCYLFSSHTPEPGPFSTLFFPPPQEGDVVYLFDAPSQTFQHYSYFDFELWDPGEPVIALAEALWLCRGNAVPAPPLIITRQPRSQTNCVGGLVAFSITVTGGPPSSFQWRKGGSPLANGGRLTGAATASLTISNVQSADAGQYDVVVTSSAGAVTSSIASLTVRHLPLLGVQPLSQTAFLCNDVTFHVLATNGPLAYQWYHNGQVVPGATNADLLLTNVQPLALGLYWASVGNACGTVQSETAELQI